MKHTRHFLSKLEQIFQDLGYRVHYGKGNFQYGHCLVEDENQIVVNRFFDVEGRIQGLLEILGKIEIDKDRLSSASLKLINQLTRDSILL